MPKGGNNSNANTDDTATAEAAPKTDKRRIVLQENAELGIPAGGEPRADFIRRQWQSGQYTRREITDMVSKAQGEEIAYQIVFQATKGVEGGPAPKTDAGAQGGETTEASA
jgi:hypothetical protein